MLIQRMMIALMMMKHVLSVVIMSLRGVQMKMLTGTNVTMQTVSVGIMMLV